MSFISNMVRNWLPSYASRATLRKEICGIGSAHEKQVVAQKNPFVISPVTQMCKNRLPLNIILTTVVAWRLPAELWGIPYSDMLTRWVDELYPDRRRIFTGKTNPESTFEPEVKRQAAMASISQ